MTKLPEKNVLDGNKQPRTTTGEMKNALGKLRDYLNELLGEDSSDKEAARQALGIDLKQWAEQIDSKANSEEIQTAIQNKADKAELDSRAQALEAEIAKRGTPVGSIDYFAMATPPAGYLKADGTAVGRETYPGLFAAIGTTFGSGDGSTTFNLPDLIDRFAQGNNTPGTKLEAGLPNITGYSDAGAYSSTYVNATGCFSGSGEWDVSLQVVPKAAPNGGTVTTFDANLSNPIYGASDTVQPPALTLLPCIKAFDAATNPGLIDITGLANEVDGKLDKVIDSKPVRYVIDAFSDGTNWYRKWSDGWLEQGGVTVETTGTITLIRPYASIAYQVLVSNIYESRTNVGGAGWSGVSSFITSATTFSYGMGGGTPISYYCFGQGAQS